MELLKIQQVKSALERQLAQSADGYRLANRAGTGSSRGDADEEGEAYDSDVTPEAYTNEEDDEYSNDDFDNGDETLNGGCDQLATDEELEIRLGNVLAKQFNDTVESEDIDATVSSSAQAQETIGVVDISKEAATHPKPAAPVTPTNPAGLLFAKADVGTEVMLFSFKLNGWETVCILDFEPSKNLHKVLNKVNPDFSDNNKWIDFKKKPVKPLS